MKAMLIAALGCALAGTQALAAQMYEWRDPSTGRLRLGDAPPTDVRYWREGEMRPEEIAARAKAEEGQKQAQDEISLIANKVEAARIAREAMGPDADRSDCTGAPQDLGVAIGMNKERFQRCFGLAPDKINVTTVAGGTTEQWVYRFGASDSRYFYFTNDVLTAIQK